MNKSLKLLVFYSLLLSFTKGLNSFDSENIIFSPGQIQTYSIGLKNNYSETFEIKFKSGDGEMIIGDKGILHFKTDFNDTHIFNLSTIEQDTLFMTKVLDESGKYFDASCRLWLTSDDRVSLFCNLVDQNFEIGSQSIKIEDQMFEYKNALIKIAFPEEYINIKQLDFPIPFLYSDIQRIDIVEDQTSYELKFKIENYNNDILYIHGTKYNYAILDTCERNNQELICKLSKEKIEQILILKNEQFKIGTMNDNKGLIEFYYVSDIRINYENVKKEDIYIKLEKLVGEKKESPLAFETNITSLPNFISDLFNQALFFKKMTKKPLMVFIERDNIDIINYLNGSILDNLHYKYNFIIKPFELNEIISM